MADRNLLLLDFQQCTGMDDLDACTSILEHHEWNLQDAVQHTLAMMESPQHPLPHVANMFDSIVNDADFPPAYESVALSQSVEDIVASTSKGVASLIASNAGPSNASIDLSAFGAVAHSSTSSSPQRIRLLNFNIEYRHYNIPIVLQDSNNVAKIKELVSSLTNIPVDKMELHGWIHKNDSFIQDSDVLRDLKLPKDNNLYLLTPAYAYDVPALESSSLNSHREQAARTFELDIHFVDRDKRLLLKFPGSKTVGQVKEDVVNIGGPVRCQVWTGWPVDDDSLTLSASGVDYPTHQLVLRSLDKKCVNSAKSLVSVTEAGNIVKQPEESMEVESDYEDPTDSVQYDDMADDDVRPSGYQPLMPDNSEDQTAAAEHFCREFASRYGEMHPVFYFGSLDDAIRESLLCKARDRKLLAIYLHHDQSIFSNVFCSQVMCAETMVAYLCNNFITWSWDLTHESNREILLALCSRHFGSVASNTVRIFKPDQLPLLLIISRNRGINEVVKVLHGNSTIDEIMMNLMHSVEVFKELLETDIAEEDERDARERVLQEQDAAYRESLEADRAKEVLRRQEEVGRQKKEEEEQMKLHEEQVLLKEQEAVKLALQQSMADMLPTEPDASCSEPVTLIRFRCPDGKVLTRRFLATDPLQVLLTYIGAAGYQRNSYKVLTTYPRRDLNQVDKLLTLSELKLCPQETLTLEEL